MERRFLTVTCDDGLTHVRLDLQMGWPQFTWRQASGNEEIGDDEAAENEKAANDTFILSTVGCALARQRFNIRASTDTPRESRCSQKQLVEH